MGVPFISQGMIRRLLNERSEILKKDNKSKRADEIQKTITQSLKDNFRHYDCDFMIETFTHFGQAPSLVYDDNGRFALSSAGYNKAVTGNEKITEPMTIFVEKNMWKRTIREAIKFYLKSL